MSSSKLYIKYKKKQTFVHKAKNKDMRRWASENDRDATLSTAGLEILLGSEVVDSETCDGPGISWLSLCKE